MPPLEAEVISIGIPRLAGIEDDGLAERVLDLEGVEAARAVDDGDGVVVGVGRVGVDGPLHAGGEVVLEGGAPAPDGGVLGEEGVVVLADGEVGGVAVRGRLARRVGQDVAAAPAAPLGVLGSVEAVGQQAQEGRRVALHDVRPVQVVRAQRADADVVLQPVVGDEARVRTALVEGAESFAGDALMES